MFHKLAPTVFLAFVVAACGEDSNLPTEDTTAAVVGADEQSFPGRGQLMERLEAEGDDETQSLIEQAREARSAAKEAFQAGDKETAHAHAREARQYLHQAIERTFPELAARKEQRHAERGVRGSGGRHLGDRAGRHGEIVERLRADADEEALALLDKAAEAREAARAAHQSGNDEEAKLKMQEAREAMLEAITRIDPEIATKMKSHRQQRTERHGKTKQP
jgi:hypothetical protein